MSKYACVNNNYMHAYVCTHTHTQKQNISVHVCLHSLLFTWIAIEGSEPGKVQIKSTHDENMVSNVICWFDLFVLVFIFTPSSGLRPPSFCVKLLPLHEVRNNQMKLYSDIE